MIEEGMLLRTVFWTAQIFSQRFSMLVNITLVILLAICSSFEQIVSFIPL